MFKSENWVPKFGAVLMQLVERQRAYRGNISRRTSWLLQWVPLQHLRSRQTQTFRRLERFNSSMLRYNGSKSFLSNDGSSAL
jgi:hypothetical protein